VGCGGGNKKPRLSTKHTEAGLKAEPRLIRRAMDENGLLAQQLGSSVVLHNESLCVHETEQWKAAIFDGISEDGSYTIEVKFEQHKLLLPVSKAKVAPASAPRMEDVSAACVVECTRAAAEGGVAILVHADDALGEDSFTYLHGKSAFDVTAMASQKKAGVGWSAASGRGTADDGALDIDNHARPEGDARPEGAGAVVAQSAVKGAKGLKAAMWCADPVDVFSCFWGLLGST
jgi:hypothetical protein